MAAVCRIPVAHAAVEHAAPGVGTEAEAVGELVAVPERVPVVALHVEEAAAVFVIVVAHREERMYVAQRVARRAELNAGEDVRDAHVRQRVVVSLEQDAYRIVSAAAGYVDAGDIGVRRTRVRAVLYVYADLRVLDREIAHRGLASAVDRHRLRDA